MTSEQGERIAKLEQWSSGHEDTCTASREENKAAHVDLWVELVRVSSRLWWIMGLIVAGFSGATYVMWQLLSKSI